MIGSAGLPKKATGDQHLGVNGDESLHLLGSRHREQAEHKVRLIEFRDVAGDVFECPSDTTMIARMQQTATGSLEESLPLASLIRRLPT